MSLGLLYLLLFFQAKHLWVDFMYQPPYMYKNKGTFGHWGGIAHSGLHAAVTLIGLYAFFGGVYSLPSSEAMPVGGFQVLWLPVYLALAEFIVHYLVDWSKMSLNRHKNWGPTTSEMFWRLLGVDQCLHQVTYIGMAYVWFSGWLR